MVSSRLKRVIRLSSDQYKFTRDSEELIQRYVEKTVELLIKECEREAVKRDYRACLINKHITRDVCERFLVSPTNTKPSEDISLLKEEQYELGDKKMSENVEVA